MEQVIKYILPALVAFAIGVVIGPFVIKLMKRLKFGQQVRDDGPQSHLAKQNTPTIGGDGGDIRSYRDIADCDSCIGSLRFSGLS